MKIIKKTIYVVLTLMLLTVLGVYILESIKVLARYQSPDGKYELIIKREQSIFASTMTMPGDGGIGSRSVKVILKDADGKLIGSNKCAIFYDSIYVSWDFENNWVWYGKGKAIDLKTGKDYC